MATERKEYLLTANRFKKPESITGKHAEALLLLKLILQDPGTDPLHPDMGVGIQQWRYGMGTLEELRKRTQTQINTYLPFLVGAKVNIIVQKDKTCNIEIYHEDMIYVYESATAPVPITLSDIAN